MKYIEKTAKAVADHELLHKLGTEVHSRLSIETLDKLETFRKNHPKHVRSYVMEGLETAAVDLKGCRRRIGVRGATTLDKLIPSRPRRP